MFAIPFRQVHLDFHTSEYIPNVGAHFSPSQFQRALKLGHVNSITLFAKCHHSWSYYPTRVGRRHPHLRTDLLGRQIQAAHDIRVRTPIYYTVGWSANDAEAHPDWTVRCKDRSIHTMNYDLAAPPTDPKPSVSWKFLCPSGPYKDLILAQTDEICRKYPVDGFFYDICNIQLCWCDNCLAAMKSANLDPTSDADVYRHSVQKTIDFMTACRTTILHHHPHATLFFNGLTKMDTPNEIKALQTHFELEDLPTTWGGYDKFPLRSRYYSNYHKPMLAMSGKFHTQWGEFGGYKHPDAITFEAASMLAFGAACSFGDQLHPSGLMDLPTYRNIGTAYRYVEKIEPYSRNSHPFSNLALLLSGNHPHDQGIANMLLESHLDFETGTGTGFLTPDSLQRYQTIILPGPRFLTPTLAQQLTLYLNTGGSLLVLAESPLSPTNAPLLPIGATYEGPPNYELDYVLVQKELSKNLPSSPFLNYSPAPRYRPTSAKTLAHIREPFFNRTYERYCSHMNTPCRLKNAPHPGALQTGRLILLPHPIGQIYHDHGARLHRIFFLNALARLYRRPILRTQLPSAARVSLLHQPQHSRYVLHLLYGPPLQRGRCSVIEDLPPLHNIPIQLRVPQKLRSIQLPLTAKPLPMMRSRDTVTTTVPELRGHQIVVFNY
ncbi:MAG: hypothetical protein NTU53_02660 [Planctomycetota bacterium]|nr:hypothetical protein [Planctomycetota bacterium]